MPDLIYKTAPASLTFARPALRRPALRVTAPEHVRVMPWVLLLVPAAVSASVTLASICKTDRASRMFAPPALSSPARPVTAPDHARAIPSARIMVPAPASRAATRGSICKTERASLTFALPAPRRPARPVTELDHARVMLRAPALVPAPASRAATQGSICKTEHAWLTFALPERRKPARPVMEPDRSLVTLSARVLELAPQLRTAILALIFKTEHALRISANPERCRHVPRTTVRAHVRVTLQAQA